MHWHSYAKHDLPITRIKAMPGIYLVIICTNIQCPADPLLAALQTTMDGLPAKTIHVLEAKCGLDVPMCLSSGAS